MKKLCIVIPCYNEEGSLPVQEYRDFVKRNPEVILCFINDGSKDGTQTILEGLRNYAPHSVTLLTHDKNAGKAEAVRRGILHCNRSYPFDFIAYLDADLSTSLDECLSLASHLRGYRVFAFGSRIMRIGSTIIRKRFRFIVGRLIASVISTILGLQVYDTQCGCKIFTKQLSTIVFEAPFLSRWLFDVEIFKRMIAFYGRETALDKMIEIPLDQWIDKGNSKVKFSYFFRLWYDLYQIHTRYLIKKNTEFSATTIIPKDA